jgi:hypothetical protein
MWIAVAGFLIVILAAVVVSQFVLKDDEPSVEAKAETPITGSPTPSQSPTLSGPIIQIQLSFFGLIPDGQENEITTEVLEEDLSEAFDVLAQEILVEELETIHGNNWTNETQVDVNVTQGNTTLSVPNPTNQSIQEAGNPKVRMRRRLEAASVQVPSSVDVLEIGESFDERSIVFMASCTFYSLLISGQYAQRPN